MSVYFIQRGEAGPIKIGHSGNPKARLAALKTASDQPLRMIGVMDGDKPDERRLHLRFADARLEGEWFSPTEELVAYALSVGGVSESPVSADERPDWEIGLEMARERFADNPVALLKHFAAELPPSAFNRIIAFATAKMGNDAMQLLLTKMEEA